MSDLYFCTISILPYVICIAIIIQVQNMVVARSIIKDHNAVFLSSHNCIMKLMYF